MSATNTSRADLRAYVLFSSPYSFVAFLLPFYIFELGGGGAEVGVAYGFYALAVVLLRPLSGAAADRLGRRLTAVAGGVALSAAMALLGLSAELWQVYAAMFLAGAASSLVNVAVIAYVTDVGGLEDPSLYSKMRVAAAAGAVGGGVSIPLVYLLSKALGYVPAFRAVAFLFAAVSLAALLLVPGETRHLAGRHVEWRVGAASLVVASSFLLGLSLGAYGPQVLPYLYQKYGLSPFAAVAAYLPAVASWFLGPRLAKPTSRSVALGGFLTAGGLAGMWLSPTPLYFSLSWVVESLGVAVVSTSLDQMFSRHVAGAYWGRGYGVYQALNNLGYSIGAFASGHLPAPFLFAIPWALASAFLPFFIKSR